MSDMFPIWWALACGLLFVWMNAADARDRNVRAEFMRQVPCPATGKTTGPCVGYEADHITPLCRGGADAVWNLQWLTIEQHKLKTRGDCRTPPGQ
jgi:hypothetical protein